MMTDVLYDAAISFNKLQDVKYKIVLGKKYKLTTLYLTFSPIHFHHLAGLHKLTDLKIATVGRNFIVQDILDGRLTEKMLKRSVYYSLIDARLHFLSALETIIDGNKLFFRYSKSLNKYSNIDADFLCSTISDEHCLYTFLSKIKGEDYYCRTFFPKGNFDYTKELPKYTLLYKEKFLATGKTIIQYNKLQP